MKVGFTCSSFDLLHAGHILMLREAKTVCDYLIVGLNTSPTKEVFQSLPERHIQLSAVKYVDMIVPYKTEDELLEVLELFTPDVRIIGEEYKIQRFTGKDLCRKLKIEIYYNSRKHSFSTTRLKKKILDFSGQR